jgi:ABC-type nitrate/sulfonate/bicarbonate transport system substrate-binding protein
VRFSTLIALALVLASCGGVQSSNSFGDVPLSLGDAPTADEAGVYLATQRGYDTAEGVTLALERSGDADFRLVADPPEGCIAVLAIVRPDKLVLCADEVILQDDRAKVIAVARALARGYTQAQKEPTEAVGAMTEQLPEADREALSAAVDEALPTWTAGARFFGELEPGPGRDPSIARDANEDR